MVLPMYLHIIGAPPIRNHRPTERQTDRQTDTRVKDLLASGVPPKGLEARAFTFGGTESSMLGRRGWFNAVAKRFHAGKKGMVQCFVKGYGSMPNRRKWFDDKSKGMDGLMLGSILGQK